MNKSHAKILERFWIAWNKVTENKKIEFDLSYLEKLVNEYGVSANWLLTGQGEMIETPKKGRFDQFKAWLN